MTVVFDLDDTLYSEREYWYSGMRVVSETVSHLYGCSSDECQRILTADSPDPFGQLVDHLGLAPKVKESLINIYRFHEPSIKLYPSAQSLINRLLGSEPVAILTDGRSITQRLKVKSLGLEGIPLYISEEFCSEKPESKRFTQIEKDLPGDRFVYIGDNPAKDFEAPNALGWKTIGLLNAGHNIHIQTIEGLKADCQPQHWVSNFDEIYALLC